MRNKNHPPIHITTGNDNGILCLHGLFGSPNQFIPFLSIFQSLGLDVHAPLLPGHGGSCKDFSHSNKLHWKSCAQSEIYKMHQQYKNVYLMGHSMGALFCLDFADTINAAGIILLNPPMKISLSATKMKMCLGVVTKKKEISTVFNRGESRPLYSIQNGSWYEYIPWIIPISGIYSLINATKKKLPSFKIPTLIFQSQLDETLNYKGVFSYQNMLGSDNLQIVLLNNSTHCFFPKSDLYIVQTLVSQFLELNSR
ncbi:alpha/beta hydrolase [Candidatus Epulonipiscium viviparus]|uniref:alpha/beta hydrolase n=1 Tax=Candidatus Epulonipiscium viviparus TaxID=420336 RepID=UPI002738058B|nr:alpha/beta fold hydrolase [Candidatus Epulopiscium viviparus]